MSQRSDGSRISIRVCFVRLVKNVAWCVQAWTNYYKDTITNCYLYLCFIEFTDWRYSQLWRYFRPSFVKYCPLTFSLVDLPHLSALPKVKVEYIQTVCGREGAVGGGGELSSVGDHILHILIQNLQNCFTPPKKNLGGEGASYSK